MPQQLVVLVAEDDDNDVILLKRALAKAGVVNPIHVVRDGEEAVAYLSGVGDFSDRTRHPLPDLLLVDLKMPKMDGFEVISWVRKQSQLSALPIVVLTSSNAPRDEEKAIQLGANSFLTKQVEFAHAVELLKDVRDKWLTARA